MRAIMNVRGLGLYHCYILAVYETEVDVRGMDAEDRKKGYKRTYLKEEIVNWQEIERGWKKKKQS